MSQRPTERDLNSRSSEEVSITLLRRIAEELESVKGELEKIRERLEKNLSAL